MFFLEDSDEEYASVANQYDVLSLRADQQRIARRNLSTAVLCAHRQALSKGFSALRSNTTRISERNLAGARKAKRLPIWRQGEFFQKQRHRRLLGAMRALLDNTGKHKAAAAWQHHASRIRAVVFGALVAYVREQRMLGLQELRRAEAFSRTRPVRHALKKWRQLAWARLFQRTGVRVADTFNVLVLMRRSVTALQAHMLRRSLARSRQGRSDQLQSNYNANAVRRMLYAWHERMSARVGLSQRMMQRRGCVEAARLVLQVLYTKLPGNGVDFDARRSLINETQQQQLAVKAILRKHLLQRGVRALCSRLALRRSEALCDNKLSPLMHQVRDGIIYLSVSRTCLGFRAQLRRRQCFRRLQFHAENNRFDQELVLAARLHNMRRMCETAVLRMTLTRAQRIRTRRAAAYWDTHAASEARRRALTQWLRYLNATLVQSTSLSLALEHITWVRGPSSQSGAHCQRMCFNKKSRAFSLWMSLALKKRRVEARRQRIARAGYETFALCAGLLHLRARCRVSAARHRASLLARFSYSTRLLSRSVAQLRYRANVSAVGTSLQHEHEHEPPGNVCSRRLVEGRWGLSVLFWKLWRAAYGLQQWKLYLNARRKRRYEWVQSQQAHRSDLCVLGVRLWVAAAGEKAANRVDAQGKRSLRSAWRAWKQASVQARIRRGISPSIVPSFTDSDRSTSYVHIRPVTSGAAVYNTESASVSTVAAVAVAAKYAHLPPRSAAAQEPITTAAAEPAPAPAPARPEEGRSSLPSAPLAPASPLPLHRVPPRTSLYDQEVSDTERKGWKGQHKSSFPPHETSPVSVAHAYSPPPNPCVTSTTTSSGGPTDEAALAALRKKSARIAMAHEIIGLVTELKGKLL